MPVKVSVIVPVYNPGPDIDAYELLFVDDRSADATPPRLDALGDEALERMYDYGVANTADVIVGKTAGRGRPVPVELFRRNHPHATVENAPLIDSLAPHKMLRRAFLDRPGLRRRRPRAAGGRSAAARAAQRPVAHRTAPDRRTDPEAAPAAAGGPPGAARYAAPAAARGTAPARRRTGNGDDHHDTEGMTACGNWG